MESHKQTFPYTTSENLFTGEAILSNGNQKDCTVTTEVAAADRKKQKHHSLTW